MKDTERFLPEAWTSGIRDRRPVWGPTAWTAEALRNLTNAAPIRPRETERFITNDEGRVYLYAADDDGKCVVWSEQDRCWSQAGRRLDDIRRGSQPVSSFVRKGTDIIARSPAGVAHKWAPKQCEILARAARRGEAGTGIRGPGESAAAHILRRAGLGQFNPFPGSARFWINDAGSAALPEALLHAEAEAARYLGNANEASESGKSEKARNLMQRSQEWLDAANELRNQGSIAPVEAGR